jgi:hypothetical protein
VQEWRDVVGIDCKQSLIDDGRLVLEAQHVVKHVFRTVSGPG